MVQVGGKASNFADAQDYPAVTTQVIVALVCSKAILGRLVAGCITLSQHLLPPAPTRAI